MLRPIGLFLQSSFPIQEDVERISLAFHVAWADETLQQEEWNFIHREIEAHVHNQESVHKFWKTIQKKPLSLEQIFKSKHGFERLDLYAFACEITTLSDPVTESEQELLKKIQIIGRLSPRAIENIHEAVALDKCKRCFPVADNLLSPEDEEEQVACSLEFLADIYMKQLEFQKAEETLQKAMQLFIKLDDKIGMSHCSSKLSILKQVR